MVIKVGDKKATKKEEKKEKSKTEPKDQGPVVLRADRLNEDKWDRTKRMGFLDIEKIQNAKVLMVGCGAIGNEVAKNLILEGFRNITIIDMDYIVRSNLNRCLFFTDLDADKKRLKAEVISEKMMAMDPDVKVEHHSKKIEDMPEDFIPSHDVVLGCLDNVGARLHINAHCYYNKVPYIDGATLGLVGKVQVVYPPETLAVPARISHSSSRRWPQRSPLPRSLPPSKCAKQPNWSLGTAIRLSIICFIMMGSVM
jgi:molybdopterin/thiamine biosynthesis adenylyltransferase